MGERTWADQTLAALAVVVVVVVAAVPTALAGIRAPAWQIELVDEDDCWFLSLALDGAELPRISYGADGALRYAWHDGSEWQIQIVEDQPGSTGWYASLELDSVDDPHISYYSPYSTSLMYAQYYSDSWHIETVGSPYANGGQTSLDLDSSQLPHIAYWDYDNLRVGYAYHDGAGWQFDTVASMTAGGQSVSLSLALDSADRPHLCYYDYEAGTLNYAYHNGSAWLHDPLDDVFYNGQDCSIALDSEGHPHISFRDLGLLYAHYNGSTWKITMVDNDFFAGRDNSLAFDPAYHPHISYSDWADAGQELRYAYFTGVGWRIETVELAAETRQFADSSLALDENGRPHIAIWDSGSESVLKYATRAPNPPFFQVYLPIATSQQ